MSGAWWIRLGRASWLAVVDLFRDDGPDWSAAIAYYALLSALPILILTVVVASLVVDSSAAVEELGGMMGDLLPAGEDQVEQIVDRAYRGRAVAGFFSVVALLWSGTRIFGTMTKALNAAYDIEHSYGFGRRFLIQVIMLVSVGGLFILGLLSRTLLGVIAEIEGLGPDERGVAIDVLQALLPFVLTTAGFFLIYRLVPRHRPSWIPALGGAVVAAAMFWGARALFLIYVRRFASFDDVYGPVALVIMLVFWVWIAAMILLLGGQLVSHYHEIMIEGKQPDEVAEKHREARDRRDRPGEDG